MPVAVKKIVLWRTETENKPGVLAGVLEPLAKSGVNIQLLMGYRYPGDRAKAAVELYPVTTRKSAAAAQAAGLQVSSIPALLVEGDDKPGLGAAIARSLADAAINIDFFVVQVVGRKYSAVIGLENEEDAKKSATLIKKASAARKR